MSEIPRSAEDNGVVQAVLGIAVGVVVLGLGIALWRGRASTDAALMALGMGGLLTLGMLYVFVSRLRDVETRNPVTIIRGDLNDRNRILLDLVWASLLLGMFVLMWEFVPAFPSKEAGSLLTELIENPGFAAAFGGFLVFMVLGILFLPRSRGDAGDV